jgi:hypothetical protein
MKSCALIRTNVGLTTNVKFVVRSNYGLYLDSIVSSPELAENRYKKFQFDKDTYWEDVIPTFFQKTPVDVAYKIKYDGDVDKMSTDFANQYDDLYQYGARNIIDNKFYSEEYEYFAPLFINKNKLPSNFIIFRVDGPGILKLDKDNFREQILKKLKFVKNYDLTQKSYLGQWINNNITNNRFYPNNSLYIDFRRLEFSTWRGIDYEKGGYTEKNFLLDTTFEFELPYYEMEKTILEGYRNNKIIFPNIINFSFLFDDTPATPDSLRKWSLNRYLGFYMDELTLVTKVSPNKLPSLRSDVLIDSDNILYSPTSNSPFLNDWEVNDYPFVEIDGVYYKIEKFDQITTSRIQKVKNTNNTYEEKNSNSIVTKYKVISDKSLTGRKFSDMNNRLIIVDDNKVINYQNGTPFVINDFDGSDVWLIEIGDYYHNLIIEDGKIKINSDYGFKQSAERFDYYINGINSEYSKNIQLVTTKDNGPIEFNIFRCKFTDIKDLDTEIVETTHSKFEYILSNSLTETDEPKMYVQDLESTNQPKDNIEFKLQDKVVTIPTSSEYTANSETFRLEDGTLTPLWRKNAQRLKWGFVGSISSNDYPYLLNNSIISEDFNKSPNVKDVVVQRDRRNLDHFYTINSDSPSYDFHSLHVEDYVGDKMNLDFKFEIDKYLGQNYGLDYFSYFFGKKATFSDGKIVKKTEKFSYFQSGDNSIPNITLFKGLKFRISEIENINISNDKIDKINLKNSNLFDSWKFSILVSSNDYILTKSLLNSSDAEIIKTENPLRWRIIDTWKHDKDYATNSLVIYEEVLFKNIKSSRITDPIYNPKNSNDWTLYDRPNIFYSPLYDGTFQKNNMTEFDPKIPPLIYNDGQYFYSNGLGAYSFWSSALTYSVDDIVTYKNKNWISLIDDNRTLPSENSGYLTSSIFINSWEETDLSSRWRPVELWRSDLEYDFSSWQQPIFEGGNYVVHNDIVYGSTSSPVYGIPPNLDSNWRRIYSLVPDTNFFYGPSFSENNIIEMNGKLYQCVGNESNNPVPDGTLINYSLDNGIYVIINEVHKNILVNIYVNDNTYSDVSEISSNVWEISKNNLTNTNRDDIYSTIYTKLSTNNLMNCLNDLSNKFGFSDNVKYVIVKSSGVKIYDFNDLKTVSGLPYLLTCEGPDELLVRVRSNIYTPLNLNASQIKSKKILNDSNIDNLSKLNYYNEMHLATQITKNIQTTILLPNYSGLKNQIYYRLYRFSGYYGPILKNIELFSSPSLTQSETNYKFDTELSDFGIIKERIISKVNRKNNLLRFNNQSNLKSIYPMIDEYGYHTVDYFMFKSTWDYEYHYETQEYEPEIQINQMETKKQDVRSVDFRNNNSKLL